jgi:hypothetical protein
MKKMLMNKMSLERISRLWTKVIILGPIIEWRLILPFLMPREGKVLLELWLLKTWRQV